MPHSAPTRRNRRKDISPSEEGYVLLAAIFFLALLVISLSVAVPRIARSIQRDREVEAFHRGMQYRRAVQLYYRKFHAYPPSADALVKTNNIRFLRKKYIDPVTGKDDWKPVLYGQNKVPVALGFFGQPLAGNAATLAGTGPSGGNGMNPSDSSGSAFGSPGSAFGSSGSPGGGSMFGSSGNAPGATGTSGATPTTPGTPGAAGASGSPGASSSSGSSSQTFGGAGIIGFSPASSKQSILVYKKKNHFNEWEFTYDPISDTQTVNGGNSGANGGSNPSGLGTPGQNGPGQSGSGSGGSNPNGPGGFSLSPAPSQPSPSAPQ